MWLQSGQGLTLPISYVSSTADPKATRGPDQQRSPPFPLPPRAAFSMWQQKRVPSLASLLGTLSTMGSKDGQICALLLLHKASGGHSTSEHRAHPETAAEQAA